MIKMIVYAKIALNDSAEGCYSGDCCCNGSSIDVKNHVAVNQ